MDAPSARRWQWLALTHLGLAVVIVMYFLTVLANTAGFSYSFWNEPAPSDAAELFAVLSLPGLAVSVVVMGYVVYGAYCVMLVDASRVVVPVRRARCSDAPSIRLYDRGGGRRRCFWRRRHRWSCFPFLAPVPFRVILSRKPPLRGPYSFKARMPVTGQCDIVR